MVSVVKRAIELTPIDFRVTEGLRTFDRQRELYEQGKSKTMQSRHLQGYAVDVFPLGVSDVWNRGNPATKAAWRAVAEAFYQAGKELKIPITWGGDFNGDGPDVGSDGWDWPHFELNRKVYR
ncbi:M15 family metallopeptidase [Enterobacter bugandensis]|uniref:M15 family metallopeptidase n=1 Tax=Enterobacter bugandensis TaxID=881260 RepID=UPI0020033E6D|nr:M15 family metallopeptidase [Enterobacter bugandensis]MCK7435909.1 M15 family metallopeptidase [Enterobacter bugandensis]